MNHFKNYINLVEENGSKQMADGIRATVKDIVPKHIETFDFNSQRTGLLLGNVQSGKTGHMLGILAAAADHDFELFVVLSTDQVMLQQQTFARSLNTLDSFMVCDEQDDVRFIQNNMRKPVVLILKKNARVLKTWNDRLESSQFLQGRSIFIVDDESDAASLNTAVNREDSDPSTINSRISDMKSLANSSFYLQVTATPQSLFLQDEGSGYKPEFVYYFKPGKGYMGGNFYYRTSPYTDKQPPFPIRYTGEEELGELLDNEGVIPNGMRRAILCFLIATAHIMVNKTATSCNFLVHPSVKTDHHQKVADRIGETLNTVLFALREEEGFSHSLLEAWIDLQKTKPDILSYEECYEYIAELLEDQKINIATMNSTTGNNQDFDNGVNIVVGGHCLGRGVTFPNLQTTYYCRKTKRPQADTAWQHCRAFGYDRDRELVRMFLPPSLFKLFADLNDSNNAMVEYIEKNGAEGIRLIYPKNVKPTRANVVNKKNAEVIAGGVNHFPSFPKDTNTAKLDKLLESHSGEDPFEFVDMNTIKEIVSECAVEFKEDWPIETYLNCIDSLQNNPTKQAVLVVRRGRNIGRKTGTLLSPNDRSLGDQHTDKLVLTMYRISGASDKGWGGKNLWIPNINFPANKFFFSNN